MVSIMQRDIILKFNRVNFEKIASYFILCLGYNLNCKNKIIISKVNRFF